MNSYVVRFASGNEYLGGHNWWIKEVGVAIIASCTFISRITFLAGTDAIVVAIGAHRPNFITLTRLAVGKAKKIILAAVAGQTSNGFFAITLKIGVTWVYFRWLGSHGGAITGCKWKPSLFFSFSFSLFFYLLTFSPFPFFFLLKLSSRLQFEIFQTFLREPCLHFLLYFVPLIVSCEDWISNEQGL